jgi:DnaJ-class molecular chaperone
MADEVCPNCRGTAVDMGHTCHRCFGTGWIEVFQPFEVKAPCWNCYEDDCEDCGEPS